MPLFYAPKSAPLQYSLQGEEWPLKTNAYSILATLGETKAQGSVTFPSGAPDVSPIVTHHAMTDPEDLAKAKEAVELARKIGGSAEFAPLGEAVDDGAGAPDMWTAVYDGRGTCRMGRDHRDSVVDHKLRVHNITGLRVVDGSVIPVGSPYLAVPEVLALAERASELIVNHYTDHAAAAAPVSAASVHAETVSIAGLSDKLGQSFSIMQAVAYLSGEHVEGLSEMPLAGGNSAGSALAVCMMVVAALGVAALAVVRSGKAAHSKDSEYLTLSA
jgi:hypothetical protein